MGFSVAASSAIIFTGLMFSAAIVFSAVIHNYGDLDMTRDQKDDRDDAEMGTAVALKDYWNNTTLMTINITNTGRTQLHANTLAMQANGTLITGDIVNVTVDGKVGSNIWNPQQVLTVNVTHAAVQGETIKVNTEHGKDVTFKVT